MVDATGLEPSLVFIKLLEINSLHTCRARVL